MLVSEKTNGPENGIATGGVDPGILYVHTTMRSMRMAWDSPPRYNSNCHPLMRRVHVGPAAEVLDLLYIEFLLAMKIMDYLKDKGPRKGSWKLGGWEAEVGSYIVEWEGVNMIV